MTSNTSQASLTAHYQNGSDETQLWQRISDALENAGIQSGELNSALLAPVDQLHIGGRQATMRLLEKAALTPESHILEIGSGLGGASRLLADTLDAHITAVDITPSFTFACQQINRILGYSCIHSICADACELDQLPDNSQDAIWSQHTIMNIPDKDRLLETLNRVLKPGGKLLLHEVIAGSNPEPLQLPVPWASSDSLSHLPDGESFQHQLAQAGFDVVMWDDITDSALQWRNKHTQREAGKSQQGDTQKCSPLSPLLVFGEQFLTMGKNIQQNLADSKISIVQAVLIKR